MTLPELRGLTARELAHALERHGFRLIPTVGNRRVYAHADGRNAVVALQSAAATIAPGMLYAVLNSVGRESSDPVRLGSVQGRSAGSREEREAA